LTALLLGPVTTAAMLYGTIYTELAGADLYPPGWVLEPPFILSKSLWKIPAREALLNSRRNLVQLSTLCSFVLLVHLCTSNFSSTSHTMPNTSNEQKISNGDHGERKMRRGRRSWNFVGYTFLISTVAVVFHIIGDSLGLEVWKGQ
jgi:dolichol kinase